MPSAIHNPDRLLQPLVRTGEKGDGPCWQRIGWDEALDIVAEKLHRGRGEARRRGGVAVLSTPARWGWCSATASIGCATPRSIPASSTRSAPTWPGPAIIAGTGRLAGPDPREMAKSDLVVIWGTNAVVTQVNVMTHAVRARKERGAQIVVIDVYATRR